MGTSVRIQIDLNSGSVNVDAPVEAIDTVFDRLESFLPRLAEAHMELVDTDTAEEESTGEEAPDEGATMASGPTTQPGSGTPTTAPPASRRRNGGSRPETFRAVDLGLKEEQRLAFKQYYESKRPKGQSQQVLVVMVWLVQNAKLEVLTREQIFTGLRSVGARVPTRLSSVLSNLVLDGYVIRDDKNFRVHHTAEDFVTHELPSATEGK